MSNVLRAMLRLAPSDREVICPKKGQMALGRCEALQGELACTCDTYRAHVGQPMPAPAPERLNVIRVADERRQGEKTMTRKSGGRAAVLEAMRAEPGKVWTVPELHAVYGGTVSSCGQAMKLLAKSGEVSRPQRGHYALAGTAPLPSEPPKAKKEKPVKAASPVKVREPMAAIRWVLDGHRLGLLTAESALAQVAKVVEA